jgi:hypothetical protein
MIARAIPVAILAAAGLYLAQALALPFGSAARPGAGFYPVAVGVFACLVALVATVRAFLARDHARRAAAEPMAPAARGRVVASVAALAAFCLILPWAGYPITAFLFVAVVLRRLGSRWPAAIALGVASAAVSHYLFAVLLEVPLPRGPW